MGFPPRDYVNRTGSYVYSVMAVGHSAATGALVVDFKSGLVDGRDFHLSRLSKEHEPNLRKAGYSLYLLSWLRPLATMAVAEMEVTMCHAVTHESMHCLTPCVFPCSWQRLLLCLCTRHDPQLVPVRRKLIDATMHVAASLHGRPAPPTAFTELPRRTELEVHGFGSIQEHPSGAQGWIVESWRPRHDHARDAFLYLISVDRQGGAAGPEGRPLHNALFAMSSIRLS